MSGKHQIVMSWDQYRDYMLHLLETLNPGGENQVSSAVVDTGLIGMGLVTYPPIAVGGVVLSAAEVYQMFMEDYASQPFLDYARNMLDGYIKVLNHFLAHNIQPDTVYLSFSTREHTFVGRRLKEPTTLTVSINPPTIDGYMKNGEWIHTSY